MNQTPPIELAPTIRYRPGGGWKFLQFPLTRILILALALIAVSVVVQALMRLLGFRANSPLGLVGALLLTLTLVATYRLGVRWLEGRPVVELDPHAATGALARGSALGALLSAAVMLALSWWGVASITPDGGFTALAYPFAAALVAAVGEELVMRGVLFRIVERSLGSWIALALSAALFGALHGFNAGATAVSSVAIALEAGVLLAAAYMCARSLWLPIGLHLGWNFTEGGIFGASVSGGHEHGMFASTFRGPDLLTGGAFGPEASVVAVVVCLALGVLFIERAVRAGRVLAPYWTARRASGVSV